MEDAERKLANVTVSMLKNVLKLRDLIGGVMERYPELIKDEEIRSALDQLQDPTADALKQLEQYVERVQSQVDT